ncbi:MAG: CHAT domain-containing protein [Anaerolineales bacterium]|nr:CHAT domain-containing protein [Anaerolineales bacterium]
MPLLRLTQHIENEDQYRIEIAFEDDDGSRQTADVKFPYQFTKEDHVDIRWYLEDYLQYPLDPAPEIASRVEKRLSELGIELFKKVFQGNDDARDLWATLRHKLDKTRVEISTDVQGANALPWELLRDPKTDAVLALCAKAFVRAYTKAAQKADKAQQADKIRILLVICRPGGREDVPFRSVASRLLKGLGDEATEAFELDVLRPPTFEQLSRVLQNAKSQGKPYHIVHFDGHGGYLDYKADKPSDYLRSLIPLMLGGPREGSHGYLFFENPGSGQDENVQLVDGPSLGKLLADTDTPVLVLNACRSAHADIQEQPEAVEDVHSQVRAFGSLAQEVMDAGVAGVVAMRYNVYVVTAAQFVADLYAALASGQTLGEAVSMGRKQLAAQPLREIAFEPRPLQDWSVPVVYETVPISLFPKPSGTGTAPLRIDITQTSKPADDLPRPDVGFYGRDETLLALDRAFDKHQVVLLHAYAGSGKTMTAAEFARWYQQTGGIEGTVLYTTFDIGTSDRPLTLARVFDQFEEHFRPVIEANNIKWGAFDTKMRKNVVLTILDVIPTLWIWDNVEPINGFPRGTTSKWTESEQQELKEFLKSAQDTKSKFLLTSRRDETKWLGDLPARVMLPPMPMQERVQLARALADKLGKKMTAVEDWKPLLKFTQGNPLTITVVVGQALRDGIETKKQVYEYLNKLQKGEGVFEDETSEGRSKSLGASLSYGFETAFLEEERKILALLHFFQGFVQVRTLWQMGNLKMITGENYSLPELSNLEPSTFNSLLDRASEIGLLTAHGGGYYTIHPALPWFFKGLFDEYYSQLPIPEAQVGASEQGIGNRETVEGAPALRATRAFVEAMGELGNYYHDQYGDGNRDVIPLLRAEEANLLHARALAQQHGWYWRITSTMQGLRTLYTHTGRRAEWRRLVEEIAPDFVGADDLPLPGREEQWSLVTQHRVLLANEERNWAEAERLQRVCVEWDRRDAEPLLACPPESLNAGEKNALRTLAVSIEQLGHIQREQAKPECADNYKETIPIYQQIGDRPAEAVLVFNLGHAYKNLPALRDLDEAERWYQRALELENPNDKKGQGLDLLQLGTVAYERFKDAKKEGKTEEELLQHLNTAVDYYQQALALLPPDAVDDLAVTHNQLGNIYADAGDLERALEHYNKAIKYCEMGGNYFNAGLFQENVALAIAPQGRKDDALLYANAAIKNFQRYGAGAQQAIQKVQRTIEWIKSL